MLPQLVPKNRNVLRFNERNGPPDDQLIRKNKQLVQELGKNQMKSAYDLDRARFMNAHKNDLAKYKWHDTQPPFNLEHLHKSIQYKLIETRDVLNELDREYTIERNETDSASFMSNQIFGTLANLTLRLNRLRNQVGLEEFRSANVMHYVVSVLKRNSRLNQFKLNLKEQKRRQKEKQDRIKPASSSMGNSGYLFSNTSGLPTLTLEGSGNDLFEILAAQSEEGGLISGSNVDPDESNAENFIQITLNGELKKVNELTAKNQDSSVNNKSFHPHAPNAGSTLNMQVFLNVPGPSGQAPTTVTPPNQVHADSGSTIPHLPPITGHGQATGVDLNASMNRSNFAGGLNQSGASNPSSTTPKPISEPADEEVDDEVDEKELKRQEAEKKKAVGINLSDTAKYLKKKSSSNSQDAADKAVASFFMRDPSLALKRNVSLITPYIKNLKKNYVELTDQVEYDVFVLDDLLQSILTGIHQDYKQELEKIEFIFLTCEKYLQSFLFDKHKVLEADLLSKEAVTETDLFEERLRSNMSGYTPMKKEKVVKITNAMNKYIESVLTYDQKRSAYISGIKSRIGRLKRIREKFCDQETTDGVRMDDFGEDVSELSIRFEGSRLLPCIFILPEYSMTLGHCIKLIIDWLNYDKQFIELLDTDVSMINRKRKNLMKLKLDLTMNLNQLSHRIKLIRTNLEQKEKEVEDYYRQHEIKLVTEKQDFSEKRLQQKKFQEVSDSLQAKLSGYLLGLRSEQNRVKEKKDGHRANPNAADDGYKWTVENINLNLEYIEEVQMPCINKDFHNSSKINMCLIEFKQKQFEIIRSNLNEIERNQIGSKLKSCANSFDQELYLLENCFYLLKEIYIHKTCADTLNKIHFGLDLPNLKFNSTSQNSNPAQDRTVSLSDKKKLIDPLELKEMGSKCGENESYLSKLIDIKTKRTLMNSIELSKSKISSNNKFLSEMMNFEKDIATILPKIPNQMETAFYLISHLIENDWIQYYHSLPFHPIRGSENKNQDVREAMNKYLRDNDAQTKAIYLLRKWNRLNMRAKLEDLKAALKTINRYDILKLLNIYLQIHSKLFKRDEESQETQATNVDPKRREAEQLHQKLVKLFDKIKRGEFDVARVHASFNSTGTYVSPKQSIDKKSSIKKDSLAPVQKKSTVKS